MNDTPIPGAAPARNQFPQAVARLNLHMTQAVVLDLCRQALLNGTPGEEIRAFLDELLADSLALIEAAAKGRGQ